MTEALAKVWGWHLAKEADPDLKLLLRVSAKLPDRPRLEPQVLGAYGVDPDDIVWIDDHVRVESLVGASPMWHNAPPFYAHPGMREVWERLRAGITDPDAPTYDRIFVSRWQTGNRLCHNATEVERAFAAHGFEVLRPERFDLATQAGMFSRARVVAGFAGSGMFNTMFCQDLEAMVVLSQDAYTARNEHLFGALLGVEQEHYFWSPALEGTEGSYERHQSSWKFDFASSGAELDEVLRSLSGR
jgi:capsular polysaccharide biosynthesis protein